MGEALSSDSQVVAWYLRDDARQRSGRLIQFGVDPDIAKYLQKSSDSEAKVPEEAREKLLSALKKVNASIPKDELFDAVFAVDQAGRVVAHLGYEQASGLSDFELGGYPAVFDALKVNDPVFEVALQLEHMALNDPYFIEKKLFPNVDFYSGVILSAIGFPTTMFTALFALARTVGWVAQWNEMISDPAQKIGRPRQLYTGPTQRDYLAIGKR